MCFRISFAFLLVTLFLVAACGLVPSDNDDVASMLDDFHDAATKADFDRYFAHFAPEGRFLGTDATENWTVGEFRTWATRHFEKAPAWVYVPGRRDIAVDDAGTFACFHEIVVNAQLGECRGTGTLRRVGDSWKIMQYNLTVPIPNEQLLDVVESIRNPRGAVAKPTTVYLVRHAEKKTDDPKDPDPCLTNAGVARAAALGRTLRSASIDAIHTSEYKRTRETVRNLAETVGIRPSITDAAQMDTLVKTILHDNAGQTVVVSGH